MEPGVLARELRKIHRYTVHNPPVTPRGIASRLAEYLNQFPVTMLAGPRQAGKSTLVATIPNRTYLTMDDTLLMESAAHSPRQFLQGAAALTIDEVQRVPEIFLPLKKTVDENRIPGRFLLTGSANILALPRVADALTGRMGVIDLLPMSQAEIEATEFNFIDWLTETTPSMREYPVAKIEDRIACGGYPEPVQLPSTEACKRWADSYLRTTLERDVRNLADIEHTRTFPRLLRSLANRQGETLNIEALARDTGMPATTVRRYVDLLGKLFLIQTVPAWSADLQVRLTKSPKLYLVDSLLSASLAPLPPTAALNAFFANELARLLTYSHSQATLFHFRTVRNKEVDFVLEATDGSLIGIQITDAEVPPAAAQEGLTYLREVAADRYRQGIILYAGERAIPLGATDWALPHSAVWTA